MHGIYRGTVTRTAGAQLVYLTVPSLSPGREYGPVETLTVPHGVPDTGGSGRTLTAGDRVVVGLLDGRPDDVVILRLLP
jgi:hypothetical protein